MNRRHAIISIPAFISACSGEATLDAQNKKAGPSVPPAPQTNAKPKSLTGINIHCKRTENNEPEYLWTKIASILDTVVALGLKMIRVDCTVYTPGDDNTPSAPVLIQAVMAAAHTRGLKVQLVMISPYRESTTEWGRYADSAAGRNLMGYTTFKSLLTQLNPKPDYIELENEITKWSPTGRSGTYIAFGSGGKLNEYNTTAFSQYADVLRGEYRAIREVCPQAKTIVGTLETAYAFIPWAIGQGLNMDVAGYHLYLRPFDDLNNLYGAGPLQANLKAFGRPVTVNELNGNLAYDQIGQQAVRGFDALAGMAESILGYELFDSVLEPGYGVATAKGVKPAMAGFVGRLKG